MSTSTSALTAASALALAGFARLATRYAAGVVSADHAWHRQVEPRLTDIGEVESVSILPLVERLTLGGALQGEAGVSYLVRAGGTRVLFDSGLSGGRAASALSTNAAILGVDPTSVDAVVISHLHVDHVGGTSALRHRTFSLARDTEVPTGLPAHVPTDMRHRRADVRVTEGPRVIAPGIAVLPPLPRAIFWLGPVAEQALAVNVSGFGLVVITGCGHPPIERMLGVTEQVLAVPVNAVVGGLHLPVHALGTPLVPQAVLGNPHWPWQPISEGDVRHVLEEIDARGPRLVALSGHDSTPWTMDAFGDRFGDRYRPLRVGEELVVDRSGVVSSDRTPTPAEPR